MGLPIADVLILADEKPFSRYFDAALEAGAPPKLAANWVLGDVMAHSKVIICQISAVRAILAYHFCGAEQGDKHVQTLPLLCRCTKSALTSSTWHPARLQSSFVP